MAQQTRTLTMGYDDPRFGGLLQQPLASGGNAGIDWETMFPSLQSSIDASRAASQQQADSAVYNEASTWQPGPVTYDASGFPKQLIDSGQITLQDLVNQFNQKTGKNNLRILPNGQVSFDQVIQGDSDWTNTLGNAFGMSAMGGLAGLSGAFSAGLGGLEAGAGGAMDMGIGGIAESMGLGAGYTSPAIGASGGAFDMGVGGVGESMGLGSGYTSPLPSVSLDTPPRPPSNFGNPEADNLVTQTGSNLTGGAAASQQSLMQWLSQATGLPTAALQALGLAGSTALGVYGSNQQSNALTDIANQAREDRAPFLNKAIGWFNDPASYYETGPAQDSMRAVLGKLSTGGDPLGSGTALALGAQAGLQDWRNAWTGAANLGLGGQDSRNQLLSSAAGADRGVTASLASGLGSLTQDNSLEGILRSLRGYGINAGDRPA